MKKIPFKPIKYRQYRNTFLQNVIITFDFDHSKKDDQKLMDSFHDYALSFFGIEVQNGNINVDVCKISKKDQSHIFLFSNGQVTIQLSGKSYESFSDSAIPQVFKLRNFFNKVVQISTLKSISIRKINVWDLKNSDEKEINVSEVRNLIFSSSLLHDLSNDNLTNEEDKIPNFLKSSYSQNNTQIIIRTAFFPPKLKDDYSHLILDTLGIVQQPDGINIDEFVDFLMDLNSQLFYSYHWSVSDYVIEVMDAKENNK